MSAPQAQPRRPRVQRTDIGDILDCQIKYEQAKGGKFVFVKMI